MSINPFTPPSDKSSFDTPRRAWRPRLKSGFFYIDGRRYYLYGRKQTRTVEEITCTAFDLASTPATHYPLPAVAAPTGVVTGIPAVAATGIQVRIEGIPYDRWELEGDKLRVCHLDTDDFATFQSRLAFDDSRWDSGRGLVLGPDNEVQVDYDTLTWDPATKKFIVSRITEFLNFRDGQKIFRLPTANQLGAPIVITDDSIEFHDGRDFAVEFAYDPVTHEITFNQSVNLLENPSFEQAPSGLPEVADAWLMEGALRRRTDGFHGKFAASVDGTGLVLQTTEIDQFLTYTFSARARRRGATGVAKLVINFKDATGTIRDTQGVPLGFDTDTTIEAVSKEFVLDDDEWTQICLTVGELHEPYDDPTTGIPTGVVIPEVDLYLKSGAGTVEYDAVQLTATPFCPQFADVSPRSTVEWESDEQGLYSYDHFIDAPFDIGDVDLNALNEDQFAGFVSMAEFSDRDDFGLRKGGPVFEPEATGDYCAFLGAGIPPTGIIDCEVVEISQDQTFTGWGPGTILAHVDIGTGFQTPSGVWQSDLVTQVASGVFDNPTVQGVAFHGVRELLEATADPAFVNETLELLHSTAVGVKANAVFAVFDAWRSVGTGQFAGSTGVASWVDILGVDGLSRDRQLHRNTRTERAFILRRTIDTANFIWDQGVRSLDYAVIDYEDQVAGFPGIVPDWHSRAEFRDFAHNEFFRHYVGPTGLTEFYQQFTDTFVPLGVAPAWPTGVVDFPQERLGRRHLIYAKVDGRQKLRKRANFHIENPVLGPEEFLPEELLLAARVLLEPLEDFYRDDDGDFHMVVRQNGTGQWVARLEDALENPVSRHPTNVVAGTGVVDPDFSFTNQQGRLYGSYAATNMPTGVAVDVLAVTSRLGDAASSLLIDVV